MVLPARPIAAYAAVMFFFTISIVGLWSKLPPFTCCKRACIAAVLAYIIALIAAKTINAILAGAIIDNYLNRIRGKNRAAGH